MKSALFFITLIISERAKILSNIIQPMLSIYKSILYIKISVGKDVGTCWNMLEGLRCVPTSSNIIIHDIESYLIVYQSFNVCWTCWTPKTVLN